MGSFGERLRREREMRGITLEEIAEATKISGRSLRALEQEQFDRLPGGIFNKGFVRAYARFLGIDEEQAVADYLAANAEKEPPLPESKDAEQDTATDTDRGLDAAGSASPSWRAIGTIILLTGLAAGGWYAYNRWRSERAAEASNVEPQVTTPAPVPPAAIQTESAATQVKPTEMPPPTQVKPTVVKPSEGKPAASSPDNAPIELRIRATADAWMEITADDKLVWSGVLSAERERVIRAHKLVVLNIGNAGGVEITYNGKALPPLGEEGKRKVLTITPEGVQP